MLDCYELVTIGIEWYDALTSPCVRILPFCSQQIEIQLLGTTPSKIYQDHLVRVLDVGSP